MTNPRVRLRRQIGGHTRTCTLDEPTLRKCLRHKNQSPSPDEQIWVGTACHRPHHSEVRYACGRRAAAATSSPRATAQAGWRELPDLLGLQKPHAAIYA